MISAKYLLLTICLAIILHEGTARAFFGGLKQQNKAALTARHVVHSSGWASMGTISVTSDIKGFPFAGLESIADGPANNGTGVPYMLLTDMDDSIIDINHNNKCTLVMSLAQGDFCKSKNYNPQDPRCARVMLTGSIEKLVKGSAEEIFAKSALYEKYPEMSRWPIDHKFYPAKLNIIKVSLFDSFGGIKYITPAEYFAANDDSVSSSELTNNIEVVQIKF